MAETSKGRNGSFWGRYCGQNTDESLEKQEVDRCASFEVSVEQTELLGIGPMFLILIFVGV